MEDHPTKHLLYPRAGGPIGSAEERPPVFKTVGLILAIASGLFIGISFVVKKVGLLKANAKYNEEAGEGYGYLKNAWWWGGMTLMIVGEVCNFVAYAFVDAILVTPLGALSVVVTTILSAIFLKERLSFVGKVGCFNCIVGSVVIVLNAPQQSSVATIQDMKDFVIAPGFLSYAGVIIVGCVFVALWVAPRYGKKSMLVYISICSLIGGLSVVATQGLGAAIVAQISGTSQFKEWFLYVLFVFVVATLLTEIIYLNKALNLFNAALVTPTYYVFFTSATIVSSAILFQGFKGTAMTITTVVMGFLQICSGVILLQLSKSAKDVPDAAVFKGDLNQVRTVAEQEDSEFEPHADAVRGSASIVRSMSTSRQKREVQEAKRIQEEHLEPIDENEQVEWDGIRRRKTIVEHNRDGGSATKTVHPPLGMSHFPNDEDNDSNSDDGHHPGIIPRLKNHNYTAWIPDKFHNLTSRHNSQPHGAPTVQLEGLNAPTVYSRSIKFEEGRRHTTGLPSGHNLHNSHEIPDGSYSISPHHAATYPTIPSSAADSRTRSTPHLLPPTPPPHSSTKRQFSFSNVFNRKRSGDSSSAAGGLSPRPGAGGGGARTSSGGRGLSFRSVNTGHDSAATEEERLGLVKGDSVTALVPPRESGSGGSSVKSDDSYGIYDRTKDIADSPPRYESDEAEGYLHVTKRRSEEKLANDSYDFSTGVSGDGGSGGGRGGGGSGSGGRYRRRSNNQTSNSYSDNVHNTRYDDDREGGGGRRVPPFSDTTNSFV